MYTDLFTYSHILKYVYTVLFKDEQKKKNCTCFVLKELYASVVVVVTSRSSVLKGILHENLFI